METGNGLCYGNAGSLANCYSRSFRAGVSTSSVRQVRRVAAIDAAMEAWPAAICGALRSRAVAHIGGGGQNGEGGDWVCVSVVLGRVHSVSVYACEARVAFTCIRECCLMGVFGGSGLEARASSL